MHQGGWAERGLNHYLFVFHDETFECLAHSYAVEVRNSAMAEVVRELAERVVKA